MTPLEIVLSIVSIIIILFLIMVILRKPKEKIVPFIILAPNSTATLKNTSTYTIPTDFTFVNNIAWDNRLVELDVSNNIMLSNGNKTVVTNSNSLPYNVLLGNTDLPAKSMFSVEVNSLMILGVSSNSISFRDISSNNNIPNNILYGIDSNGIDNMGNSTGVIINTEATDIIDVAVDRNAKLIWFRRNNNNWNNLPTANPTKKSGGLSFSEITK
jgi:hypothetical protein